MKKRLALGILVVLLLLLLPVALHTFKYQQLRAPALRALNALLATQKLHLLCEQGINWSNLSLQERCEIRHKKGELWFVIEQDVHFYPTFAQAELNIQAQAALSHLQPALSAQGRWRVNTLSQDLVFSFKNNELKTLLKAETPVNLQPVQLSGQMQLQPPFAWQMAFSSALGQIEQLGQSLGAKEISLSLSGFQQEGLVQLERLRVRIAQLQARQFEASLVLHDLHWQQLNQQEGQSFHSYNQVQFADLRYQEPSVTLGLEETNLAFYLNSTASWRKLKSNWRSVQRALAQGGSLVIERAQSRLNYEDLSADPLSLSTEIKAHGRFDLSPTAFKDFEKNWPFKLDIKLALQFSPSLLNGEQGELMQDFVDQGWLHHKDGMLETELYYTKGLLLANERLITTQAYLPKR